MSRLIRVTQFGDPDVMQLTEAAVGEPGPGEVRIRHHAIGINFIDIYQRSGLYPNPLPLTPGQEGAGVIEAVGEDVTHLAAGDRAAYAGGPPGAYAEVRVMPATAVVRLPDAIAFDTAAALMLKGLTVQYLLRRTLPQAGLAQGDAIVFHAAAGGVGLIACQWARHLGLHLIATAGSDDKCALALAHGAAHAINYRREDVAARVRELTHGRGVNVVYDGVGRDTFEASLNCLAPFGLMVSFGNASGKVPPVDIGVLAAKGSLHLTRPTLFTHIATREAAQAAADELFAVVQSGAVRVDVQRRYTLDDAPRAHHELAARQTVGAGVFTVPPAA